MYIYLYISLIYIFQYISICKYSKDEKVKTVRKDCMSRTV